MASTYQGAHHSAVGDWPAATVYSAANNSQGGITGGFYTTNRVIDGDKFRVRAILANGKASWKPPDTLSRMTEYVNPPRDIAASGQADLFVQNNFYLVEAGGERDGSDTPSRDGLAFGGASWLGVLTGTDFAPLPCRVEVLRRMPPKVDRGYEMAAEHDLQILHGFVKVTGPQGQMPHLWLPAAPGLHRCRVHVRGRSRGLQIAPIDAPGISRVNAEQHYIQIWPSVNARVPEVLYGPDDFARTYR